MLNVFVCVCVDVFVFLSFVVCVCAGILSLPLVLEPENKERLSLATTCRFCNIDGSYE